MVSGGAGVGTRGLPSRPSQDLGYRAYNGNSKGTGTPEQTNGYTQKQNSRPVMPTTISQDASPRTMLDGYREDIVGGFGADKARFNLVSS